VLQRCQKYSDASEPLQREVPVCVWMTRRVGPKIAPQILPVTVYVGRDGKIVEKMFGLKGRDEIEDNVKELLAVVSRCAFNVRATDLLQYEPAQKSDHPDRGCQ
jgi:hypothetical protein